MVLDSTFSLTHKEAEVKSKKMELKEVLEKFAKAKDDLTIKMEMENWFPKWKKVALAWISKITISIDRECIDSYLTSRNKFVVISFPAASSCQLKIMVPIIAKEVAKFFTPQREMTERTEDTGLNADYLTKIDIIDGCSKRYTTWLCVSFFRKYRKLAKLKRIPINLHADIISRLVSAFDNCSGRTGFGLKYAYETEHNLAGSVPKTYPNWMWCDNQHLFPGITQVGEFAVNARNARGAWIIARFKSFVGSKLLAVPHYRTLLLKNFANYQSSRVIDNWFCSHGKKLLGAAQKFFDSLSCEWQAQAQTFKVLITVPKRVNFVSYQFQISDSPTSEEQDQIFNTFIRQITDCKHQSIINSIAFNSSSCSQCRNRALLTELIGDLTDDDLRKIFRIFIECQVSDKELQKIIDVTKVTDVSNAIDTFGNLGDLCQGFPSAADHFESFDPLHLRGTLTLAPLSLKLAAHAENIDRLRKEAMDSLNQVPIAVVDLMESYLPV